MEQPDTPKEEQRPEPQDDALHKAIEPTKRQPKFGFYRETKKIQPAEMGKKPASMVGGQSAAHLSSKKLVVAMPAPRLALPGAIPPEAMLQPGNQPGGEGQGSGPGKPAGAGETSNPGRRLHQFEEAAKKAPPFRIPWKYRVRPTRETTRRAYWDVATTFSLIINVILVCILISLYYQIRTLKISLNALENIGNNALGGLYGNFVKMDQASINTTIAVDAQIPLNFNLPVSQNTSVVLTNNVNIPNAHVVINTGGLNINSLASVTLPAGTALPIALNMTIPVQSIIPISLQIPVSIPLNQTDLHAPFTGLQTTIRPLYCMLNKNAQYPEGTFICTEHDALPTGTP
jgi:hypothetical protein